MSVAIVIALWAALGVRAAGMPTRSVDLDRPGALEGNAEMRNRER